MKDFNLFHFFRNLYQRIFAAGQKKNSFAQLIKITGADKQTNLTDEVKNKLAKLISYQQEQPAANKSSLHLLLNHTDKKLNYNTGRWLAAHQNKDLYRVYLSRVVSKYIGETEKNLDRVFSIAHNKDWILFFDEADALFSKRTDVKDAHDRHANVVSSYFLQHIKQYTGIVLINCNTDDCLKKCQLEGFKIMS